jgi:hypothetical protein
VFNVHTEIKVGGFRRYCSTLYCSTLSKVAAVGQMRIICVDTANGRVVYCLPIFWQKLNMFPTFYVILQTVLLIIGTYIFYHAVSIFMNYRQNKKIFNGAKGPEKYHWLFGSFFYVSFLFFIMSKREKFNKYIVKVSRRCTVKNIKSIRYITNRFI